jgi:DNA-binding beta-propeller fold protein YncE
VSPRRLTTTGVLAVFAVALLASAAAGNGAGAPRRTQRSEVGPAFQITANGRHLQPAGKLTRVGDFPTGGALTRDGRFYWAVDAGHGHNDVQIVHVASGRVVQVLPLPGAYGGIVFSPDGATAYVAGEPRGNITPTGPTKADAGDAVHVFSVRPSNGRAVERTPIQLPPTSGGTAQTTEGGRLGWPEGMSVTRDGSKLLVALNQADALAVVDLVGAAHTTRLVRVGKFPYGVVANVDNNTAFVSNELDGTVSVVDLAKGVVVASIGVGGARGDLEAHPEGLLVDARRQLVFVAVTNRDLVAVIDIATRAVLGYVSVGRKEGIGTAPLALAESPDGRRLYVADSGEDALAVIGLPIHSRKASDFRLIGRLPTAAYPSAVAVSRDGHRLVWLAAKGLGAGPNPEYAVNFANSEAAPYGSYVPDKLLGYVGVLRQPSTSELRRLTARADAQVRPANWTSAPAGTPVVGPNGGPSQQIKHVFYVVRENRTYDQIFGSEPRGAGDPKLEVVDDNGKPGPAGGVTPNAHALARRFPLLDHVFADSEVSTDGHVISASAYAIDFVQKALHADYAGRGRVNGAGQFPETYPPNAFVFDQAARQDTSFQNFGEFSAGLVNDGRPTFAQSRAGQDFGYPFHFGCDGTAPSTCSTDSGHPGQLGDPKASRFDHFQQRFGQWLVGGDHVPSFVYLTLPNDHTNGVSPGKPTPKALIADNDLGLGQLVQLISHSSIWHDSAIFVIEDDSQDGADHIDAHRMPAFVISPYAKAGAVVHTRYDQYSALRTAELMLGLHPLALTDSLATPMYDAFTSTPDLRAFDAIQPEQSLTERNPARAATRLTAAWTPTLPAGSAGADARNLALALPFDKVDLVPQELSDQVLWHSVYGWGSTAPGPGPGASPDEQHRALVALDAFHQHRDITDALELVSPPDAGG